MHDSRAIVYFLQWSLLSIGWIPAICCDEIIQNILDTVGGWKDAHASSKRPFVTLTFAQSLDGKIALLQDGSTSSNLALSGPASLVMTHGLRSLHDAIIIGGQTLSTDNPRLSNRLWGDAQPRPVVLDTTLQHLRNLPGPMNARNVILCCSEEAAESSHVSELFPFATILPCRLSLDTKSLDLCHVLELLKDRFGIRSLMVEGGAAVISSFASANLVDCICVTIAPKVIGNKDGLAAFSVMPTPMVDFQSGAFLVLGSDCIFLAQWPPE
jgi:GTP cyclohydrolase II